MGADSLFPPTQPASVPLPQENIHRQQVWNTDCSSSRLFSPSHSSSHCTEESGADQDSHLIFLSLFFPHFLKQGEQSTMGHVVQRTEGSFSQVRGGNYKPQQADWTGELRAGRKEVGGDPGGGDHEEPRADNGRPRGRERRQPSRVTSRPGQRDSFSHQHLLPPADPLSQAPHQLCGHLYRHCWVLRSPDY